MYRAPGTGLTLARVMLPMNLALAVALCVSAGVVIALAVQDIMDGYFWEALLGGAFLTWVLREIFK